MRTLKRYVGREVLLATLLIFAALLMLFAFFDLIHELGDVGRGGYTISAALLYVALHVPGRLYELFPVAALIGTLFAIAQLVANSEYTVMRASGMSLVQLGFLGGTTLLAQSVLEELQAVADSSDPARRARDTTPMLRIESPPSSKKLSWAPTCSTPSTSAQIPASVASASVRGAT